MYNYYLMLRVNTQGGWVFVLMYIHIIAAVLGLVLTGCDISLTMREEVQYMWKKPITFVRCLFVLMRYLPIALHVINVVLTTTWIEGAEAPEEYCWSLMILQSIAFCSMLVLLELVLILRVFALYDRSRAIGTFLSLLLVFRNATTAYSIYDHLWRFPAKTEFTSHCVPSINIKDVRNPVLVITCGELFVQLAIITLAMKRTVWDFRQYSHSLLSVSNRDGLRVFGAIAVALVATTATSVKKGTTPYFFFVFPLFIALISAAGCHTILNLRKLESELEGTDESLSEQKKDIELTTIGDVNLTTWDTPWDARTFQMIEEDTITSPWA
ncbi:hypothetical protein BDP27DRAFT_1401846 [Rhodocollybia butyracea]|uniref:DUF6533 domain-containing protein n=1 Tax=Rhodocollybia butyracea TaxID=206335 RepID=A0A9P5U891_9AGAR|nr:hypothetical protein BDP27DRAFT_1401846 [Rhodocollybia butyracea]